MKIPKIIKPAEPFQFTRDDTRVVKAVAVILMIVHHLFIMPERFPPDLSYRSLFSVNGFNVEHYWGEFGKICVAIFMLLSGYGTYLSLKDSGSAMTKKIYDKVKGVYLAYWKVFLIFIPIGIILGVITETDFLNVFYNFTAIKTNFNGEWWFMTPFVITILLFPLCLSFINRKKSNLFADVFWILTFAVCYQAFVPVLLENKFFYGFRATLFWEDMNLTFHILPQFLMGCVIAKYHLFEKYLRHLKTTASRILSSAGFLIVVYRVRTELEQGDFFDFLLAPLLIISLIIIIKSIPVLYRILLELGKETTTIWLTHSFYCYYFCPYFVFLPKVSVLIVIWLTAMCFVTAKALNLFYKTLETVISHIRQANL